VARKKKHPEHVNNERWLVSYADFITLLFAFFVVMFAVSQVDSKKVGRFSESFHEALESNAFNSRGLGLLPNDNAPPKASPAEPKAHRSVPAAGGGGGGGAGARREIQTGLARRAQATRALAGLRILDIHGELVLRLPEQLMFNAGDATLADDGRTALDIIGDELAKHDVTLRVEGHTDNKPIKTVRYPSNWDLSTARATAVIAFLVDTKKLNPVRLSAAGYGEYHPIAENETAEGRALNRRVDIVVIAQDEPAEQDTADLPKEPTR
jgi:chemotaxis protein MotB